jgi:N-acetyl-alpha-D-muramate 1-phosphate uridylyltransferase
MACKPCEEVEGVQIVILAGGLATRLRPLTEKLPKSLVPVVDGKPFIAYQIELLKRRGIADVLLCTGFLGEQISDYCGDGSRFGLRIRYSEEGDRLLGTAGALKHAEPLLAEHFFLLYGDSYLLLDYDRIMRRFEDSNRLGLMVVYRNRDPRHRNNVAVEGNVVSVYDKVASQPGMIYIDEGLSVLRRQALGALVPGQVAGLKEFYQGLIRDRELLALETAQRFYEIGSPAGLAQFQQLVRSGGIPA